MYFSLSLKKALALQGEYIQNSRDTQKNSAEDQGPVMKTGSCINTGYFERQTVHKCMSLERYHFD